MSAAVQVNWYDYEAQKRWIEFCFWLMHIESDVLLSREYLMESHGMTAKEANQYLLEEMRVQA